MLRFTARLPKGVEDTSPNTHTYRDAPFLHTSTKQVLAANSWLPEETTTTKPMNLYSAINDAMQIALRTDETSIILGEDVAFGGVFRCTMGLHDEFGDARVFNTPLCEQAIIGFSIGYAAMGHKVVAEVQFADYVFPAFDQIVNEAAKYRYRSASIYDVGGLTIRMPCGGVGHGALYHSQSPEAFFAHAASGLTVVVPRSPLQAKGLLLSAIRRKDPVLFLEPKILYRASVEHVPVDDFEIPIGQAEIIKPGNDLTIIGYGTQLYHISRAVEIAEKEFGISCEIIDLRTIIPWDKATLAASVNKTGRAIVCHEASKNNGIGAELAAELSKECFLNLEAPIQRVTGWDTPIPLSFERFIIPDVARIYNSIKNVMKY
ncbi:Thiamin diphosphate-binding protein [Nadsonia fulvescens var. elongata DSM 6958]|uniref:3-methyl-2-oxobutanoate dehydrogenase (2-methylpropanoyl-transferring) n=1 Tax=Nadsonia fulvescens var. elongata DSM 6958 TaxID=857566 RepID=A0A1E3PNF4_9ASCO|nr:Thiamin diphosphate-binding protein [Nadsonia fulvescens var. elongata DSM 6958]